MKELDCAGVVTVYSTEATMEVGADIMWRLNVSVTCCVCVLDRVLMPRMPPAQTAGT